MMMFLFGFVFTFFLQSLAFFWGAKLAGVKNVKLSRSLIAAFLTLIILAPINYVSNLIPILFFVSLLLLFIIPTLIVKEIYKINIEKAFWAAFGAVALNIVIEVSIKILE
jgi:hypothetical protein